METQTFPAATSIILTPARVGLFSLDYPRLDPTRISRAADLVVAGAVESTRDPHVWLVVSATEPHRCYRVRDGACNCRDAETRDARGCKHAASVLLYRWLERRAAEQAPFVCDRCGAGVDYAEISPDGDVPPLCAVCAAVAAAQTDPTIWITVEPEDEAIPYELVDPPPADDDWAWEAGAGEPCEWTPEPAVGTVTRIPYTAEQRVYAAELGMLDGAGA